MQGTGRGVASGSPGVAGHRGDRGVDAKSQGKLEAPMRAAPSMASSAASPSPDTPIRGGDSVGLGMRMRSTINAAVAVHSGCCYTPSFTSSSSSNVCPEDGAAVDVTDPLEQQLVTVRQCVRDCREALLLAREWDSAATSLAGYTAAASTGKNGVGVGSGGCGGAVNTQEAVATLLLRAVMDFEERCARSSRPSASSPPKTIGANSICVSEQVLCLLSQQKAREREHARRGAGLSTEHHDGAEAGPSHGEMASTSGSNNEDGGACSSGSGSGGNSSSESDNEAGGYMDEDESREGTDALAAAMPRFLRFRKLFTRKYARVTAPVMSTRLAEELRYASLVEDMRTLAHHLLIPFDVVRHHQRLWLFTGEDVKYTLEEQLYHHRVALRPSSETPATARNRLTQRAMPAEAVARLWSELWELLGALWRQRSRLFGVYSAAMPPSIAPAHAIPGGAGGFEDSTCAMMLTNTKALPPFMLPGVGSRRGLEDAGGEASRRSMSQMAAVLASHIIAAPPAADASPYHKDRYARHVSRFWRAHASESLRAENAFRRAQVSSGTAVAAASQRFHPYRVGAHSLFGMQVYAPDDALSVGPLTPTKIGLVLSQPTVTESSGGAGSRYVIRDPLSSIWRSLRCCLPTPASGARPAHGPTPTAPPTCIPFFDVSVEDVSNGAAVPYVAPEVYTELCEVRREEAQQSAAPTKAREAPQPVKLAVHSYSDDAWSLGVVTLEAALLSFDISSSHLVGNGGARTSDPAAVGPPPSSSVFADTMALLVNTHGVAVEAAHNFLYAALYHFSHCLTSDDGGGDTHHGHGRKEADVHPSGPCPRCLAQEWRACLTDTYGAAVVEGFFRELCLTGLCWRREDRWLAFCNAHVPSAAAAATATAPLLDPSTPVSPASPKAQVTFTHGSSGPGLGRDEPSPSATLQGALSTMSLDGLMATASDLGAANSRGHSRWATPHTPSIRRSGPNGSGGGSGGAGNAVHSNKQIDRAERQLDLLHVPLLPALPLAGGTNQRPWCPSPGHEGEVVRMSDSWPAHELWRRLERWRHRVERAAAHASGSHGAVGPQRQSILFTELLRLGREAVLLTCSSACANGEANGEARYAVADHPFIRGVIERGQLPTYASLCGTGPTAKAKDEEQMPSPSLPTLAQQPGMAEMVLHHQGPVPLASPSLYIPLSSLRTLFARVGGVALQAARLQAHERQPSSPVSPDRPPLSLPPQIHTQDNRVGSLQTLLGDTNRVRPPRLLDVLPPPVGFPARTHQGSSSSSSTRGGVAPVLLRRAAWGLTREVDVNVALQLHITGQLRRLLLQPSSFPVAAAVRTYLIELQAAMRVCLVPLPATIRGDVWGALLGVPEPRRREALYSGLGPTHRTLADRQIAVDTPRCHQYHPLLSTEQGQEKLQRVLKAWLVIPREAPLSYWQGLDSVCAILLTASYTDEALVLAELDAVVHRFVAHQEATSTRPPLTAGEDARGTPERNPRQLPLPPTSLLTTSSSSATSSSMEAALRQFGVTLRYCDPLLATHIFSLDCPPQLFAISWLLTLFAHSLPARQVYYLWDFLFLYSHDYPHCLMCMCCAFLLQKRTSIMGQDASGVLAALGSGGGADTNGLDGFKGGGGPRNGIVDVVAVLADTAVLMRAIPPGIGHQPESAREDAVVDTTPQDEGANAREVARMRVSHSPPSTHSQAPRDESKQQPSWQSLVRASEVALMDVTTLLTALAPLHPAVSGGRPWSPHQHRPSQGVGDAAKRMWWHAGVYLVDVRDAASPAVAERILGSMRLPLVPPRPTTSGTDGERSPAPRRPPESDSVPHAAATVSRDRAEPSPPLSNAAAEAADAFDLRVSEVAAELLRQLRNPSMAAVAPCVDAVAAPVRPGAATADVDRYPDPSPLALKTAHSPHVVLIAPSSAASDMLTVAQPLALELMRCGVHNVSILLGGVELVKQQAPWLIVPG